MFASIMGIALPTIIDMFVQTLLGFFDMLMVSKLGYKAISAVGVGIAPLMAIFPVFFAVSIGTTALVSRSYGARDKEMSKLALGQSLLLGIPITIVITSLLFIFNEDILHLVGNAKDMDLSLTKDYYNSLLLGLPCIAFNVIFFAAYRSISKANLPMISNIICVFLNIFLNYILIFRCEMGVVGAGIATTLSRFTVLLIFVYLTFFTRKYWVCLKWRELFHIDKETIKRIFNVGVPAGIEQGIYRIGMLIFEMMVISLGAKAYTAHKIALTAEAFSYNLGFGFSVAGTALVGQQLGKKFPKKAYRDGMTTTFFAILVMSTMGLIFLIFPTRITKMFSENVEIIILAGLALRLVSVCQPFQAIYMVLSGCLRGAGATRIVLIITTIGMYAIRLPLTYFFLYKIETGLAGAWIVMTIDLAFRSTACWIVFKRGSWKTIKV